MQFTVAHIKEWLLLIDESMQKHKKELTRLDQSIGDGDHGINMARGFHEVVQKINPTAYHSVADILKDSAWAIISHVGGAAGPLYGTAFLNMADTFEDKDLIDDKIFIDGLDNALQGIKKRGKAIAGEKTMVDVWEPILASLKQTNRLLSEDLMNTAKSALHHTKDMVATKGRAAYFKEDTVGYIDPGAMSSYYIFLALAKVIEEDQQ